MWWLTVPVVIYSAGLVVLWLALLIYGEGEHRGAEPAAAGESLPQVSVVVAARDEEERIGATLERLAAQDYPAELMEVVIVNDNSVDRTPIIVSEFIIAAGKGGSPLMRLVYSPFQGKKKAMCYGIGRAAGKVILTTDADSLPGPRWVRSHAEWYISGHADSLSANVIPGDSAAGEAADMVLAPLFQKPGSGFPAHFGLYEFSALQAVTAGTAILGFPVMCNGANMSFRRDVYLRHADELRHGVLSGDDMFLLHAVRRRGGVVRYEESAAAAVETAGAVRAAALLRQRARWASKSIYYRDAPTLIVAAATAACNAAITAAAVTACITVRYLPVVITLYAIRIVPDWLVIASELKRRGGKIHLLSFVLSEVIYPFYFMTVGFMSILPGAGRFRPR